MYGSEADGAPRRLVLLKAADTDALGRALGASAPPGAWLLIGGDLGVGKTTLIRGVAAGMGASGRVTSPTFVIVHEHPRATSAPHAAGLSPQAQPAAASETRPTGLVHADLYRVRSDAEAQHLALAEYADDGWVVAVEWPERWHGVHEDGALVLSLTGSGEGARELHVISMPDWAAPALATVERA